MTAPGGNCITEFDFLLIFTQVVTKTDGDIKIQDAVNINALQCCLFSPPLLSLKFYCASDPFVYHIYTHCALFKWHKTETTDVGHICALWELLTFPGCPAI